MMTDNELDNLFKNTLSNHEASVPDAMWQRIQPGGAKKRPVVLWWKWTAVAAVLLLAGLGTWWYANSAKEATATSPATYAAKSQSQNNAPTVQGNNSNSRTDATADAALQQNQSSSFANNSLQNTRPSSQTNNVNKSDNKAIAQSRVNQQKGSIIDNPLNTAPSNHENTTDVNKENANQSSATNNITNDNNPALQQNNSNNYNNANQDNAGVTQTPTNAATTEKSNNAVINDNIVKQNATPNNNNSTAAASIKKDNKKTKLPWTIELFATGAYADKQTYAVVKENTIGIAAPLPQKQPKPTLLNYGAGARIGFPLSKKLTFKTGVQFAQTRQKADYQQQIMVDMVTINGPGDTSFYRQFAYQTEHTQSTYNAVSVPVLITYTTGKKIKVDATAGVIVNAYSWYSGKVPNGTFTATLNATDTYKSNTGVAAYAGVSVAKKIGSVDVFAEPHVSYSLNSFTKPSVPFKQKINTYGVNIGIRKTLHK